MWWRPFPAIVRWYLGHGPRTVERCASLVEAGEPVLIFMRSRTVAGRRRRALAAARVGHQFLREVVRAAAAAPRPAFLVPVALFPGTGFHKRESRFAALLYSVQEAPGEAKRLFNYLWNAGQTQLTLGKEISLMSHQSMAAGEHQIQINAADLNLAKGLYFVKLITSANTSVIRMIEQ